MGAGMGGRVVGCPAMALGMVCGWHCWGGAGAMAHVGASGFQTWNVLGEPDGVGWGQTRGNATAAVALGSPDDTIRAAR